MMRPSPFSPGSRLAILASFAPLALACGSSPGDGLFEKSSGGGAFTPTGGTSAGGSSSGGSAPTSTGGASQGGSPMGGTSASGGAQGGSAATGGVATGGTATGGTATGGTATGGTATGGSAGSGTGGSAGCVPAAQELCDGVDNNCNTTVDEGACPAKCTGFVALGHSYMVCNVMTGQPRAAAACEAQGMRLAWIESAQENAALVQAIAGLGSSGSGAGVAEVFIGASDSEQEGQWRWGDGALFWQGNRAGMPVASAYANWSTGRPNDVGIEDCAVLVVDMPSDGTPGQWNDTPCAELHGALCEKP